MKNFKSLFNFSCHPGHKHLLSVHDINLNLIRAEYAVRGFIPTKAQQIKQEMIDGKGSSYPFKELTECNVGNPQTFGQPPLTFFRQCLSGVLYPELLNKGVFHQDVVNRVKKFLSGIPCSVGAYSESHGYRFARQSISKFIAKRDGLEQPDINDIILTDGASQGIYFTLSALCNHNRDGVFIPIPQYPLYSAAIALAGAQECHYYLDEQNQWQVSLKHLQDQYNKYLEQGIKPKLMVVINPGNPTGQILTEDTIREIIQFANERKMVILADEVYQANIYTDKKEFISFKKVKSKMPAPYNKTDLFSYHSTSKGVMGECGIRGGYMEMSDICPGIKEQIIKFRSIFLCSNTIGQCLAELMTNPPTAENSEPETYEQFNKEYTDLLDSLKKRAKIVHEKINKMDNLSCNEVEGAMYAFAKINFSQKAIDFCASKNMVPDVYYCLKALEQTGIVLVPGSGFRQEYGTHHFRTTTLVRPDDKLNEKMKDLAEFNNQFHKQFQ